jgi:valyl-tRNA synthetase
VIRIPDHPQLEGLEERWAPRWDEWGTYRFGATTQRADVYSIDTPPPTVSGSLHMGNIFSFTQTDFIARFQRMRGKVVFYPIGWDDNGLPTERRVQNHYGVRCDPSVPYDPDFSPPARPPKHPLSISRPNFLELCHKLTAEDEKVFEALFRRIGLSVDWETQYTTIGALAQQTSQRAFLRMVAAGHAYRQEAPTLWDVDFQTAVAQAELEDREIEAKYHRLRFRSAETGEPIEIDTTRPELLPACVALVANPDDPRYRALLGTNAVTPLFGVEVPIHAHPLADPEKGSGIAMVCTFGDLTDVTWWRDLGLATRTIVTRDGRLGHAPFGSEGWESRDASRAAAQYAELEGLTARRAQGRIVELLAASARDRLLAPVVRPHARAARHAHLGGPPDLLAPRVHAHPLRGLGRGPHRGLEHLPPALLRRALPRLVCRAGRRLDRRRQPDPRPGRPAPARPGDRRPRRLRG